MDLVAGVDNVVVIMDHVSKDGSPKLVPECTLPLTGKHVVSKVITTMGVFEMREGKLVLIQVATGVTVEDIAANTSAAYTVDLKGQTAAA